MILLDVVDTNLCMIPSFIHCFLIPVVSILLYFEKLKAIFLLFMTSYVARLCGHSNFIMLDVSLSFWRFFSCRVLSLAI